MTAVVHRRGSLRAVALVVGGLLLVAVAFGAPDDGGGDPFTPESTGPLGARGLVVLLDALGADVELVRGAPPDDAATAVLLQDLLAEVDVESSLDWVGRGGVLVVADDTSPLADDVADGPCPSALAGVDSLDVGRSDGPVGRDDGVEGTCFDGTVRTAAIGDGTVVALSTPVPLSNDLLDEADDAVLAAALLAPSPGTRVAFIVGPSVEAAGEQPALSELVADRVRQGMLLGGLAVLLWAAWRGRRLGRPVLETQPVAVAGSELVVAVGRLLDARRQPAEAAAVLRADLRRAVGSRLGLTADADSRTVAAAVAARSGLDQDRAAAALGDRPVTTDADLLAVAADLDRIRTDILGSRPS